ncbi:hypothetical protein NL676_030981 [Syzygium grande]|nr:hypothetical protein NL676_030981 [Syzygium grande]
MQTHPLLVSIFSLLSPLSSLLPLLLLLCSGSAGGASLSPPFAFAALRPPPPPPVPSTPPPWPTSSPLKPPILRFGPSLSPPACAALGRHHAPRQWPGPSPLFLALASPVHRGLRQKECRDSPSRIRRS